jgi:hypothetical protein
VKRGAGGLLVEATGLLLGYSRQGKHKRAREKSGVRGFNIHPLRRVVVGSLWSLKDFVLHRLFPLRYACSRVTV